MYFLKNYKINFSNFIYNNISEKFIKNPVLRFSPEPNNYLHIGHFKNLLLNIKASKIFNGKFLIRIDDTNNKNLKKKYIKNIKNLKNQLKNIFKFNFIKKIKFSSKNFNKIFQYVKIFIKNFLNNLSKINKFKKGFFKEKKNVIFYKNKKLKLIIYKINYNKHIKTKKTWYIYPLYDFSQPLLDKIENICYSLCSLEFEKNKNIYNKFKNLIYKKLKQKQIESNKLNFKNNLTSKKKLIYLKKINFIKNFKDFRLFTIKSLIEKNFKIKNLIYFFNKISINKKNKKINLNIFEKFFNENLYFNKIKIKLIENPILINFLNYKKSLKYKKFYIKKKIIIEKFFLINKFKIIFNIENYLKLKENNILKIIGFKKNKKGNIKKFFSKIYLNLIKKNFYNNINWINFNNNLKIKKLILKNIIKKKIIKIINFKSIKKKNSIINIINLKKIKIKNLFIFNEKKIKILKKININKIFIIPILNDSNV